MKPSDYWQNFELLKEIEIAGGFIYDGLRTLNEMEYFHYETEIFNVLYNLSVGLERLTKVSIVLLEYQEDIDSDARVRQIQHRLNNRPKKVLGFKTPIEIYNQLRSAA